MAQTKNAKITESKKARNIIIAPKSKFCDALIAERTDEGLRIKLGNQTIAHIDRVVNFVQIMTHETISDYICTPQNYRPELELQIENGKKSTVSTYYKVD